MNQYIGLICLLVALLAFFMIWTLTINARAKTLDEHKAPELGPSQKASPVYLQASLAPDVKVSATAHLASHETKPAQCADQVSMQDLADGKTDAMTQDESPETKQADCLLARTHLEIAKNFFDTGDFSGSKDMCSLVLENPNASQIQIEEASRLAGHCD